MTRTVTIVVPASSREIAHCTECPHHEVHPDPDPHDWFCHDDVKIKCSLSGVVSDGYLQKEPWVTVACRPHHVKKETAIPDWCPLLAGSGTQKDGA